MTALPSFRDHLADDNRLLRFYDHWTALKGARPLPRADEFVPDAIKDLLPSIAIVEPRGRRYFVVHVGAEMANRIGSNATGLYLDQHASGRFLQFMLEVYRTVCERRRPALSQTTYGIGRWNEVKLRRLSLPFADDKGAVGRIISLVLFSWRVGAEPLVVDYGDAEVARHRLQAVDEERRGAG
jgi:hypothetical protein